MKHWIHYCQTSQFLKYKDERNIDYHTYLQRREICGGMSEFCH